jgi:voltage-dependent potassium channel beta subunit
MRLSSRVKRLTINRIKTLLHPVEFVIKCSQWETIVQYRKIGKWGVKVSEVALGSWLTYGGSVDDAESMRQIDFAVSHGVNFIDTANVYAGGHAEEVVGRALRDLTRDDIFVATKVFFPMGDGPNDRGLSRKHVVAQCHRSLRRLQTDYIDLYQCHRYDPETPMEELVSTMTTLIQQGKILYWGVSEWAADKIQLACDVAKEMNAAPPVSNQPCYNMLQRDIEQEVIPTSWKNGIGQVCFSPLAQGVLTGKYRANEKPPTGSRAAAEREGVFLRGRDTMSALSLDKVQQLGALAKELNLTTAQLALAWILRLREVNSVIIGATNSKQIQENVTAAGVKLPAEALAKIDRILDAEMAKR